MTILGLLHYFIGVISALNFNSQLPTRGLSIGSPLVSTLPNSMSCDANAVFAVLKLCGAGMLIAIVTVVIVEAKNTIISNNAAFRFNFSPPFFVFSSHNNSYRDGKEKSYMELSSRRLLGASFGIGTIQGDAEDDCQKFLGHTDLDGVEERLPQRLRHHEVATSKIVCDAKFGNYLFSFIQS